MELTDEELLAWKPRMGDLTVADKIEQAETLKRQANLRFKRGELKRALAVYAKVFAYVNGLSVAGDAMAQYASGSANLCATPEEGAEIEALKVAVWSNMAFCHVKLGTNPDKALEFCDKVLALDSKHSKAQFRKAQALAQLSHFDRSLELLRELLEVDAKDAAVRGEVRRVQQLKREYDAAAKEKERSAFGNIFNDKR